METPAWPGSASAPPCHSVMCSGGFQHSQFHSLFCREVPAEPEQTEDAAALITENTEGRRSEREEDLEILQESHEDPTGPSEEPETWEDLDQNVDQREAAELLKERQRNEEDVGKPEEELEESSREENARQPQTPERPERFDPLQMTDRPPPPQQQQRCEELEQPRDLPQLAQPANADLPDQRAAGEREEGEQERRPEQTEPPEQKEQLVQPRETDEPEITGQPPAESEATEQTAEGGFSPDNQARTSRQLQEVEAGVQEAAEAPLANGEQVKAAEPAAPHANGCEADGEMARRLAERLFKLDGFQRVDVVKHLDKE